MTHSKIINLALIGCGNMGNAHKQRWRVGRSHERRRNGGCGS